MRRLTLPPFQAAPETNRQVSIPQDWRLALQKHPAGFEAIKYTSRFVDQPCLALFDRDGLKSKLKVQLLGELENLDAAVDWLHKREAALV